MFTRRSLVLFWLSPFVVASLGCPANDSGSTDGGVVPDARGTGGSTDGGVKGSGGSTQGGGGATQGSGGKGGSAGATGSGGKGGSAGAVGSGGKGSGGSTQGSGGSAQGSGGSGQGSGGSMTLAPYGKILYDGFSGWDSFQIGSCPTIKTDRHPPFKAIQKLATTNQQVRILVYGQSLSMNAWVDGLRTWLKQQYPNGNLLLESHARAGCCARCLVGGSTWDDPVHWYGMGYSDPDPNAGAAKNRLPGDVFAWKPDLVIFHVLTDYKEDYDLIMKGFKDGCAAFANDSRGSVRCTAGVDDAGYTTPEILVQTDPRTTVDSYPTATAWKTDINETFVPAEVSSVSFTLAHNWMDWKGFLDKTGVPRTDLEASPGEIHFSDNGHRLMVKTTAQHLCYP